MNYCDTICTSALERGVLHGIWVIYHYKIGSFNRKPYYGTSVVRTLVKCETPQFFDMHLAQIRVPNVTWRIYSFGAHFENENLSWEFKFFQDQFTGQLTKSSQNSPRFTKYSVDLFDHESIQNNETEFLWSLRLTGPKGRFLSIHIPVRGDLCFNLQTFCHCSRRYSQWVKTAVCTLWYL